MKNRLLAAVDDVVQHARRVGRGGGHQWKNPTPEELRLLRKELGMSQLTFAQTFGFDLTTVRNWEQGRAAPRSDRLLYLKMIQAEPAGVLALLEKVERCESGPPKKRAKVLEEA